ncbi:MAG: selenocysteine-specific translation elongation factor [Chthoniobacterales bacterium]
MPDGRHLILATAGHVDHGKTALIKALTGTDTDRLPEEKARGITIDLGFAHLALPGFSIGVIDVPGHEDFIRNMIAGIGSIDLALLVVAADDGWMPQTEEHLQILDYLGIRRGVVAITKSDLAASAHLAEEVRARLRGSSFRDAPIIATSVRDVTSLEPLRKALTQESEATPRIRDVGKARLFVDRAFTIRGAGTIVTGTLTGGELARGSTISLQPQNRPVRVRALQSHNQTLETALPATRVALNLPDVQLEQIPRGTLLTTMSNTPTSRSIDALLRRSERVSMKPLKSGSFVQLHYGSARQTAWVRLLERDELETGAEAIARLIFDLPVFAFAGDRFLVRDSSARATIAGGVVLDPDADGTRLHSSGQQEFLRARAAAPNELHTLLCSQLRRDGYARSDSLLGKSSFSRREVERLAQTQEFFHRDGLVADLEWWRDFSTRAAEAIEAAHATRPNESGLDLTQLRTKLAIGDHHLFETLIADLCEQGFSRAGSVIKRVGHQLSLPPQLQRAGAEIRAALAAQPFQPPSRKDLAGGPQAQEALRFLVQTGEVLLLNDEVVVSAAAFREIKTRITRALQAQAATTSELRQLLGTTRRVLIPLLEHLDKIGLTIREGDRRRLR